MIIGECPYEDCHNVHMIPIADRCPAFSKETCDDCGREYWVIHSRINPEALTPAEFDARFVIEGNTVKEQK